MRGALRQAQRTCVQGRRNQAKDHHKSWKSYAWCQAKSVGRSTRGSFVNGRYGSVPILPKERDPRLITIRRGGSLTDEYHRLLADWALLCAEHVLYLFEDQQPGDSRPRDAIDLGRAWIRGEVRWGDARQAAFQANAAARGMPDPAKFAALSAGQAAAVPHVAAHELGAAAYAIRAASCTRPSRRRCASSGQGTRMAAGAPPCRYPRTRS